MTAPAGTLLLEPARSSVRCAFRFLATIGAALLLQACDEKTRGNDASAAPEAGFDAGDPNPPADAEPPDAEDPDAEDPDADGSDTGSDAEGPDEDARVAGDAGAGDAGSTSEQSAVRIGVARAVTQLAQLLMAPNGGVYLVGSTDGAVDPAAKPGTSDALVARVHPDGRLAWARQLGDTGAMGNLRVEAADAVLSRDGDLILVGNVQGQSAFQGQTLTSKVTGFVAAFGPGGVQRWLTLLPGQGGRTTVATHVETLADGSLAVVGSAYSGTSSMNPLGATEMFIAWLSSEGTQLRMRDFDSVAGYQRATATASVAGDLVLAYETSQADRSVSSLELARLDAAGEVAASLTLDPKDTRIPGLAPIAAGVCAVFQYNTSSPDAGLGADYGVRCYDSMLHEQRSYRGGTPGAFARPNAIACSPDGVCAIAGIVDVAFEGEAVDQGKADGYALGVRADGTRLFAQRFGSKQSPGSSVHTEMTAIASAGEGRFVVAGQTGGPLFGPALGFLDGFIVQVE